MPRLDAIKQFYQDGGYIKPPKRNPAEAVARVRAAATGTIPKLKMDVAGSVAQAVERQGLLPFMRFTKNFVGNLPKPQSAALQKVGDFAKKTGKEALVYGRLPGESDSGQSIKGVTKPIIKGQEGSVRLPSSYFRFLQNTQDDPGQLWSAHSHPGATSSAVPSGISGDLGVWLNKGQTGLLTNQTIDPTPGPWQEMLINAPHSNTALKLDPAKWLWSGPNAPFRNPAEALGDPKFKELLNAPNYYSDPLSTQFPTRRSAVRQATAIKDWSAAHGLDVPGISDWSPSKTGTVPGPEEWLARQQAHSARLYDVLGKHGIGGEMDYNTPFANTDTTQREALPSFLNYWRRYAERPGDVDYGISSAVPERQLNLGLARGGRPGFAGGNLVAPAAKKLIRVGAEELPSLINSLRRYADPAASKIADWTWKPLSQVAKSLGERLPTTLPPHVMDYGDFMRKQADTAGSQGLTPRDVLKGYTTTLSSIQRQAIDRGNLPGIALSSTEQKIRPEGAFADWLGSKWGQKYLDYGAQGEAHPEAVADAAKRLRSFGLMDSLSKRMMEAPGIVQGTEGPLSEAVWRASRGQGDPSEWSDVMAPFKGIGAAKKGFMGSTIGYGGRPTLDARQLALHTDDPDLLSKFERRGGGLGGEQAVDRLAGRQNALGMFVPPEYQPFGQHLMHHAYWDAASGTETPHADIMDMMLNRARGGRIGFAGGGSGLVAPAAKRLIRVGAEALPKLVRGLMPERRLIEQIAKETGHTESELVDLMRSKQAGIRNDPSNFTGWSTRKGGPGIYTSPSGLVMPEPLERPRLSPLDLYGKDNYGVMGMSDRTAAGGTLESVNKVPLDRPVRRMGGSDFPHTQPEGDVWASDQGALSGLHNAVLDPKSPIKAALAPGATKDSNIFYLNKLMGAQAGDQSYQNLDTATQLLHRAPMTTAQRLEFDERLRPWKYGVAGKQVNMYPDWIGADKPADEMYKYLRNRPMGERAPFMKFLDQAGVQKLGAPDPTAIRMMTTDPALYGVPEGTVGRSVSRIDPHNPFNVAPENPHPDYPVNFRGQYLGTMDRPMSPGVAAPDWWKRRGADPRRPSAADMTSWRTSPVVQRFDQQWLDQAMKEHERQILEGEQWTPSGLARGGALPLDYQRYHTSQWQDGYAQGGKVAFPRRDEQLYHSSQWQDDWA